MSISYLTKIHRHATPRASRHVGPALVLASVVIGCAAAYAATNDTTSEPDKTVNKTERVVSDSWITTKVKSEILANSASKAFKVHVKTTHGAVALTGKLPNQDAVDLVKTIAEKVKGVQSVDTSGLQIAS